MKHPNINLGDLINLDGLEKPGEGVVKLELGGKPEKAKKLAEGIGDLSGKIEDHNDVNAGEVAGLVEVLKSALVRELSPEKSKELLKTLQARFENRENKKNRHPGIEWKKVQEKLEASPEKLGSLNEMEKTGGEPDVLGWDEKTGEYIFIDCSAESPTGRRNCVYDREGEEKLKKDFPSKKCDGNAVSKAALMRVSLLSESEYRELQTKGEFDKNSWSWLKTPLDKRGTGDALFGARGGAVARVVGSIPSSHYDGLGFRGSLRV